LNKKLEIGLLVDCCMISSWEYEFIEELKDSEYSRIALVVMNEKHLPAYEWKSGQGSFIFRLHQKIDQLLFLRKQNYAVKKDICKLIKDGPSIRINSTKHDGFECFNAVDCNEIRRYNLDIIIKIGYGFIKGDILKVAPYGVWSYSMTNFESEKEDTTGYYEVVRKKPVTVSELVMLKDDRKGKSVLTRVFESTCSYSISLNRDKLFRRASFFMPRVIYGTYLYGSDYLKKLEEKYNQGNADIIKQLPAPSYSQSIFNLVSSTLVFLRQIFKKLAFTDSFSWTLLFKIGTVNDFLNNSYGSFVRLKPSKDKFWADPFVVSKEGKYHIFVEEFMYKGNKGHISVLELDKEGQLLNVQKIIEKPYHMSYPFIFDIDNNFYMIPETGGDRSIDLYKCTEFPGKWVFVKSIMDNINAVDSTLFYHNNKWWLFTVIDKIDSVLAFSPELYLFYADDFLSENWISHPQNPVVSDVRSARPAGKIFIKEGKIFRPSQDCSGRYGNSFDINQILTLTETEYREKKIIKVKPEWDISLKGTHTFNFDGNFTIIDAYSFRKRFV
jgi:hypothetical protein